VYIRGDTRAGSTVENKVLDVDEGKLCASAFLVVKKNENKLTLVFGIELGLQEQGNQSLNS
jgi:hypothetical protein